MAEWVRQGCHTLLLYLKKTCSFVLMSLIKTCPYVLLSLNTRSHVFTTKNGSKQVLPIPNRLSTNVYYIHERSELSSDNI